MANPLVQRLELYTRLSRDEVSAVAAATARAARDVEPRRDLYREGDEPRAITVVLRGWACGYKMLSNGQRQIINFIVPGEVCDMSAGVLRQHDWSVGSVTPLRVAEIPRDEFDALTANSPRLLSAFQWQELVSFAIQREWTLNVGQRTAYERIAHLFCELFVRLHAVGLTRGDRCDFPLTQTDLADATGLTPVHVNRTLQELRRNGLIELGSKTLIIPDVAALQAAALFNRTYLHLDGEGRQLDAAE